MHTEESQNRIVGEIPGFAGDVLKLASGTAFAQMVPLLAAPILTRLYAPEAFGVVALFAALTGIVGVISCMRYELAIMLPERDDEASNLLGISMGFAFIISLVTILMVWWGHAPLVKWLKSSDLGLYLWMVPPAVFIAGVFLVLNYWDSRARQFGRLSVARGTSSLITTLMILGLGFSGHASAGSMIGAGIVGQTVATTLLGGQIWRDDRKVFINSIRWQAMREGIIRYKKFPLYDSWASLMNVVSTQLPPLLLATFFSPVVVGFYALGYRLLSMPSSLIGGAISQVFLQRAAAAKYDGTLSLVVHSTFTRLMALGLFPFLLVMIIGKECFSFIFGSQWAEAGVYTQILAPWILFNFVSSPISMVFSVMEMQRRFLLFNSILLGTRVVSLVAGGLLNSITITLVLFSVTGSMMYLFLCFFILKKSGLKMKVLTTDVLRLITMACITLLPIIAFKLHGVQLSAVVIASFLFSLLYYYAVIYFYDKELGKLLAGYCRQVFSRA